MSKKEGPLSYYVNNQYRQAPSPVPRELHPEVNPKAAVPNGIIPVEKPSYWTISSQQSLNLDQGYDPNFYIRQAKKNTKTTEPLPGLDVPFPGHELEQKTEPLKHLPLSDWQPGVDIVPKEVFPSQPVEVRTAA